MPAAFNSCMNSPGHKVFTVKPNPGTYIHVCKPSNGGGSVGGEVHHKKKGSSSSSGPKKSHTRATRMKSKTGGSFRKGGGAGRIGRRR